MDWRYLLCAAVNRAVTDSSLCHFKRSGLGMELLERILLKFGTVLEPWPVPSAQFGHRIATRTDLVFRWTAIRVLHNTSVIVCFYKSWHSKIYGIRLVSDSCVQVRNQEVLSGSGADSEFSNAPKIASYFLVNSTTRNFFLSVGIRSFHWKMFEYENLGACEK